VRIIAAFAFVVFFVTSAVADGILLTCTNLDGKSFTGSGGITKPGWDAIAPETKYQVKLAITNQKWDIIRTNGEARNSALGEGCSVGMYPSDAAPLDMLFIVACKDDIETMLFYVREGQDKLITTDISRHIGSPYASVTQTADCHKGD
jgi:hypothetical protein